MKNFGKILSQSTTKNKITFSWIKISFFSCFFSLKININSMLVEILYSVCSKLFITLNVDIPKKWKFEAFYRKTFSSFSKFGAEFLLIFFHFFSSLNDFECWRRKKYREMRNLPSYKNFYIFSFLCYNKKNFFSLTRVKI